MIKIVDKLYTPFVNLHTEMYDLFNSNCNIFEKSYKGIFFGCIYTAKEMYKYLTKAPTNVSTIDANRIGFKINRIFLETINYEPKIYLDIIPCNPLGDKIEKYGLDMFEVRPRVDIPILTPNVNLSPHFKTMFFSYRNYKSSFIPITFDLIFKDENNDER